jgi:transposase-like protein
VSCAGLREPGAVRIAVGGDRLHRRQDQLHGRDATALGTSARTGTGQSPGATMAEQERLKALEREVKELRRANEILRLASAFFAQAEFDRRLKS